jgi:hypothetical protein
VAGLQADEASVTPLLRDRGIFPVELFPGVEDLDESELLLEALQDHFPGRVLDEPPARPLESRGEPSGREGDAGVSYIRVGNLGKAMAWIQRGLTQSVALIDLRYVHASLDDSIALGALLAGSDELAFDLVGQYGPADGPGLSDRLTVANHDPDAGGATVIVLTNNLTSGPLEAVLAELQANRRILIVGTRTAGLTATHRRIPGNPGWYAVSGEIRPDSTGSLIGIGIDPAIQVETDPEAEAAAYAGFDPERPLSTILEQAVEKERFDEARLLEEFTRGGPVSRIQATPDTVVEDSELQPEPVEPGPIDHTLRSAFYVIEGMRALGRIDTPNERE